MTLPKYLAILPKNFSQINHFNKKMLNGIFFIYGNSPKMHIEFPKLHSIQKIKIHILILIKDSKYEMV